MRLDFVIVFVWVERLDFVPAALTSLTLKAARRLYFFDSGLQMEVLILLVLVELEVVSSIICSAA